MLDRGDREAHERIEPRPAGQQDYPARRRNACGHKCVIAHVRESGPQV